MIHAATGASAPNKGHPAHPRRDRPDIQVGRSPNRFALCFPNGQAAVVNTARRQRPAVIFPRLRNINFISAARAGALIQPAPRSRDSSPCPADYGCRKRISGLASARPTKGLSGGTPPGLRQADHFPPAALLRSPACALIIFRPASQTHILAVEHQPLPPK